VDILGAVLEDQAAQCDIQNLVDAGTCSAMDVALCILEGVIRSRNLEKSFVTLEVDANCHAEAAENLCGESQASPPAMISYSGATMGRFSLVLHATSGTRNGTK
jgi:hypothetical protein